MAQPGSSRRTPLGLAYASSGAARPVDWTSETGDGVHRMAGAAGTDGIRLFDLTTVARFGLKGRGAADWLRSQELAPPERINTVREVPSRDLDILRLGTDDVVLLSRPDRPSSSLGAIRRAWAEDPRKPKGFDAWRDEVWAWFHVAGEGLSAFMARTCSVDLHPDRLAKGEIAQTRVAHMDCVVVRTDRTGRHGLDLLFDIASSDFMLTSLGELGGA